MDTTSLLAARVSELRREKKMSADKKVAQTFAKGVTGRIVIRIQRPVVQVRFVRARGASDSYQGTHLCVSVKATESARL